MSRRRAMDRLQKASVLIESRLGLHYPTARLPDLELGLARVAEDLALGAVEPLDWLFQAELSQRELQALAQRLTVGETYFFRDESLFHTLEHEVFPELLRRAAQSRRLRIWSAGCATGEEPYSLAMLLDRLIPDFAAWEVQLLASDLNANALERAARGIYKEWSFRQVSQTIKDRFFVQRPGGSYELIPRIRTKVRFLQLNLIDGGYPWAGNGTSDVDLILCRNVLMYFSAPRFEEVTNRLGQCLARDGLLAVSAAEASRQLVQRFQPVQYEKSLLYRKNAAISLQSSAAAEERPPGPALAKSRRHAPPRASAAPAASPLEAKRGLERVLELSRQGFNVAAEDELSQILLGDPRASAAFALRARWAANQGRLQDALLLCDSALAAQRLDSNAHQLRASILRELGRTEEATDALRRALYLEPGSVLAHFALGNLALRRGELVRARKHLKLVLSLLQSRPSDEELPFSDGMTSGALLQTASALLKGLRD